MPSNRRLGMWGQTRAASKQGPYLLDIVAKDMVNPSRRIIYEARTTWVFAVFTAVELNQLGVERSIQARRTVT